ncbi:hypothetical protein ACTQ50_10080 [Blautia sp. Sow4_E7]|uniref:COG1470 family protein n=1 Tax=Blautia sp. Sow4_E7 TaxID=3438749 RepID=UPI003F902FF3
MRPKKIIAMVMTFLMMLSLLPSLVFASAVPEGELGGKLKIKGTAAVGSELSADYTKASPEGLTDDYVSFSWSRKVGDQLTEVGTEKTYKLTDEDLGNKIQLKITGKSEMGVTGELKANTVEIVATPEEAPEETTEVPEGEQEAASAEEPTEDVPAEDVSEEGQTDESAQAAEDASADTQQDEVIEIGGEPTDSSEDVMQPAEEPTEDITGAQDSSTDDSVIDIGTEDYLEIPEDGQSEAPAEETPAEETPAQEAPVYTAEVVTESGDTVLDFGTVQAGFTQADAESSMMKTVTIKNTGTGTLNFQEISPEHFMVQDLTSLAAGESADAWIMPREGTEAGTYSDTITYTTEEGVTLSFNANLTVEDPQKDDGNTDPQEPAAEDPATPAEDPATPAEDPTTPAEDPTTPAEDPATPEEPVQNVPDIKLADESVTSVDFSDTTITQGTGTDGITKTVTIKNNGTGTVNLEISTESGKVQAALDKTELPADGSTTAVVTVQPIDTTTVGTVTDNIIIANADSDPKTTLLTIPVTYTVQEQPAPSLTADVTEVTFDSKEAGYTEAPAAKTVHVSNNGNVKLTGITVTVTGSAFAVSAPSQTELEANADQAASFTVAPITGLAAGTYNETISIKADQLGSYDIPVGFTVTEAATKLTAVGKVSDITVANGVEKSADGLQLPGTVKITTNKGEMNASVKWDVKGCAYNQNSAEAQKFSVNGTVVLPDGVTNPDNLSLVVSANVSVKRGPIVSDAANNTITGISSDGVYTTETKITFTAVGAGMDIENPIKGDVRYQPLNWEVLEARSWDSAPYSATFRMGKTGSYTLTVTYNQQKFDGSNWVNTGTQDTKKVSFTVNASPNQTLTPAADKTDANQKKAVKTGDNTPILPFVIILLVAVALIAGILVYRNKKK